MSKAKKEAKETAMEATPEPAGRISIMDPWERWGFSDWPSWPAWFGRRWPDRLFGEFGTMLDYIKVEEYMEDGTLVVRGEIPGVDPDKDIEISVDKGRLSIRAERRSETRDDSDGFHSEFHYGSFSRTVTLPEGADVDDIDASYVDGILEVRIPMKEEAALEAKKVPVKRG